MNNSETILTFIDLLDKQGELLIQQSNFIILQRRRIEELEETVDLMDEGRVG